MRRLRIVSQWTFGLLFLFLFLNTRYMGEDVIPYPVNAFFQIDALAAFTSMAASRRVIGFFWPLLLVVPAALLFGRFFCGWICPMGSLLDLVGRRSRVLAPAPAGPLYRVKDVALLFFLAASLLAMNLSGIADPLSLLIRSLAMGVVPPLERALHAVFDGAYRMGGPVAALTEPVYRQLQEHVLSFLTPAFRYTALFFALMALLVLLELSERRFWCRDLCPLGALYGWLAAASPLGLRINGPRCTACGECSKVCRMGAIEGDAVRRIRSRDCTLCHDCTTACQEGAIGYRPSSPRPPEVAATFRLTRRQLLAGAGGGVVAPLLLGTLSRPEGLPSGIIRPPGAAAEGRFLSLCLRCGECMRVCLTNGLQPTLFEAGVDALWTPRLVSRVGYCEYSCTLCGQVCPTGAITHLDLVAKRQLCIGTAVIDRNSCIPFVRPEQCMVCEEHCPTPQKAIVFDRATVPGPDGGQVQVLQPRVIRDLCIGCGICENKCPIEGSAAIIVVRDGEDRSQGGI